MIAGLLEKHLKGDFLAAFAYGSGVFKQRTHHKPGMLDFIVLVRDDDWLNWHRRNRLRNPKDYPAIAMTSLFKQPGSVYFVPGVQVDEMTIKYGVVRLGDLRQDLLTWSQLYLAGRLQKPTLFVENSSLDLSYELKQNYSFALAVAMLSTPQPADFKQILGEIVGLSYAGDPRPEAPGKVESIVQGQFKELEAIYFAEYEQKRAQLVGLNAVERRIQLLQLTPSNYLSKLYSMKGEKGLHQLAIASKQTDFEEAVKRIVRWPAWRQMLLGAFSCKPTASLTYALSKLKKRFT